MKPFSGKMVITIFACSGFQCGGSASCVRQRQLNAAHWLGRLSWIAALAGRARLAPFARGFADLGDIVDLAAKRAAPTFPSGKYPRIGVQRYWRSTWHPNPLARN